LIVKKMWWSTKIGRAWSRVPFFLPYNLGWSLGCETIDCK